MGAADHPPPATLARGLAGASRCAAVNSPGP